MNQLLIDLIAGYRDVTVSSWDALGHKNHNRRNWFWPDLGKILLTGRCHPFLRNRLKKNISFKRNLKIRLHPSQCKSPTTNISCMKWCAGSTHNHKNDWRQTNIKIWKMRLMCDLRCKTDKKRIFLFQNVYHYFSANNCLACLFSYIQGLLAPQTWTSTAPARTPSSPSPSSAVRKA